MNTVLEFLGAETAAFALAALIHAGVLAHGYEHRAATIAESVIGTVLFLGLVLVVTVRRWTSPVAVGVQAFALLGTLVGIFTIIVGVGPRSALDVGLHAGFVALLVSGLVTAVRGAGTRVTAR